VRVVLGRRAVTSTSVSSEAPSVRALLPPLAKFGVELGLVAGIIVSAGAIRRVPFSIEALIWLGVMGCAVLGTRAELGRAVIPIPHLLFLMWWVGSVSWSVASDETILSMKQSLPGAIGIVVAAAMIDEQRFLRAVVRAYTFMVFSSAALILVDPAARGRAATANRAALEGWRGGFGHKNGLAGALVMGLAIVLVFAPKSRLRTVTLSIAAVLFVGARSATGLVAGAAVVAGFVWFRAQEGSTRRLRAGTTAIAALVVSVCASLVLFLLPALLAAYGKDLTFTGRTAIWRGVINAIADRPVFGYGVGAVFSDPPGPTAMAIVREAGYDAPHPHQGVLSLLLGVGAVGLVLYAASLAVTVIGARLLYRSAPKLTVGVVLIVGSLLLMSLAEAVLAGPVTLGLLGAFQILVLRRLVAPLNLGERPQQPI